MLWEAKAAQHFGFNLLELKKESKSILETRIIEAKLELEMMMVRLENINAEIERLENDDGVEVE